MRRPSKIFGCQNVLLFEERRLCFRYFVPSLDVIVTSKHSQPNIIKIPLHLRINEAKANNGDETKTGEWEGQALLQLLSSGFEAFFDRQFVVGLEFGGFTAISAGGAALLSKIRYK